MMQNKEAVLKSEGLWFSQYEHDGCGVGFYCHIKNQKSHEVVEKGFELLKSVDHRGAKGAEVNSGDGAGILVQIPHEFFLKIFEKKNLSLPQERHYAPGIIFLPKDQKERQSIKQLFEKEAKRGGLSIIDWRDVGVNASDLGEGALKKEPRMEQVFIARSPILKDDLAFERKLYILRKSVEHQVQRSTLKEKDFFHVPSLSCRTIVYKGMLTTHQLEEYFLDLKDPLFKSALALVHSRFSTNTHPSWPLAQPFRFLAHNGEINTLRGNINWCRSKEAIFSSEFFSKEDLEMLKPILSEGASDSAILDQMFELLVLTGHSIEHAMMMLIPEAWENDDLMEPSLKAFYRYHATLVEPWDGPASVVFSSGDFIAACLDRNGLRPSRFYLTKDDFFIMSSEIGVIKIEDEKVALKGRLKPGGMLSIDLQRGVVSFNDVVKKKMASLENYIATNESYLTFFSNDLKTMGESSQEIFLDSESLFKYQKCFGYTTEDFKIILAPMMSSAAEPIGSMGTDTPLAVFSEKPQSLFNYFYQLFAQVTNPPIDPIREKGVMNLGVILGSKRNMLSNQLETNSLIELESPILTDGAFLKLKTLAQKKFRSKTLSLFFDKKIGLKKAIEHLKQQAHQAVKDGYCLLILSDQFPNENQIPIPSLLATSVVHHHLIPLGRRAFADIILQTGEAREVHHFVLLFAYGASAVNPYLAFTSVRELIDKGLVEKGMGVSVLLKNYIKAVEKGILKVMSKMGISTLRSYRGAQIFEAVGLSEAFVNECFPGTVSRIGGIGFELLEEEAFTKHQEAYGFVKEETTEVNDFDPGGQYAWRHRGERHLFNPTTIHKLQHACRRNDYSVYQEYADMINEQKDFPTTIRGLLDFKNQNPIPLEEVESIEGITKRFATGAMSFGSISWEAHTTLAIAMNRIGGKSNTGEGGEDPIRFKSQDNGDDLCSAIKQVASGRFGVTSNYLAHAKEIQIKIAQGAKPGEGGQLPGHKVDTTIAKVRCSTPGVGLISPPPHHDIYSIEDLAQLIFDLKNSNDRARVSVKLVSEVGVGTIASGVAKAYADLVVIAGYDGGTGASPQTSIKHAGLPWELGLAETHQVLLRNKLRDRIVVQTDGQIKTGRDVVIAALLGAEEWGVATSALVAMGCIMMRKCHLNTCPVGVATQDKDLRKLFTAKADHVVNLFHFMAKEVRQTMANLGFKTVDEMIGRTDKLKMKDKITHPKAKTIDLNRLLYHMGEDVKVNQQFCCRGQENILKNSLDYQILSKIKTYLDEKKPYQQTLFITNNNRAFGTILSSEISRRFGEKGLPENHIFLKIKGSAGQSFAAFGAKGLTFELEGDVNDYFAKGLCGAKLILYHPRKSKLIAHENVIMGNVAFYGATSGKAYIGGLAGERFCVRNSGAKVVVESIGDHGCEYMTGGRVIILGAIGKNFAAGMSGGIAYIFEGKEKFKQNINLEMVDLDPLSKEDFNYLKEEIETYHQSVHSVQAEKILKNWQEFSHQFLKVIPKDYKRVLLALKEKKSA